MRDGTLQGANKMTTSFHRSQTLTNRSSFSKDGDHGVRNALLVSLGYMAQILRLYVTRTLIYGKEAEGGYVCKPCIHKYTASVRTKGILKYHINSAIAFASLCVEMLVLGYRWTGGGRYYFVQVFVVRSRNREGTTHHFDMNQNGVPHTPD